MRGRKSPTCGACGSLKVKRNNRLVCMACNRRYAREAIKRNGNRPMTDAVRATKNRNRQKVRPSGLTNARVYSLKADFGIDEAVYLRMFEAQNGQCAICRERLTLAWAYVDHDHETRTVRGLLCRPCNIGLGHFYDNPSLLRDAATYIEMRLWPSNEESKTERKESIHAKASTCTI